MKVIFLHQHRNLSKNFKRQSLYILPQQLHTFPQKHKCSYTTECVVYQLFLFQTLLSTKINMNLYHDIRLEPQERLFYRTRVYITGCVGVILLHILRSCNQVGERNNLDVDSLRRLGHFRQYFSRLEIEPIVLKLS